MKIQYLTLGRDTAFVFVDDGLNHKEDDFQPGSIEFEDGSTWEDLRAGGTGLVIYTKRAGMDLLVRRIDLNTACFLEFEYKGYVVLGTAEMFSFFNSFDEMVGSEQYRDSFDN
jgi:hypothetical protein